MVDKCLCGKNNVEWMHAQLGIVMMCKIGGTGIRSMGMLFGNCPYLTKTGFAEGGGGAGDRVPILMDKELIIHSNSSVMLVTVAMSVSYFAKRRSMFVENSR